MSMSSITGAAAYPCSTEPTRLVNLAATALVETGGERLLPTASCASGLGTRQPRGNSTDSRGDAQVMEGKKVKTTHSP